MGRMAGGPADTVSHQTPGRPPPQTSADTNIQTRLSSGSVLHRGHYLRVVDGGAASAEPLAACSVSLSRLARSATEPGALMPTQQRLTLQDTQGRTHRPLCDSSTRAVSVWWDDAGTFLIWYQNRTGRYQRSAAVTHLGH